MRGTEIGPSYLVHLQLHKPDWAVPTLCMLIAGEEGEKLGRAPRLPGKQQKEVVFLISLNVEKVFTAYHEIQE